ncbi:DUF1365 family protein, partial [Streptomyces avicenniae]|uniref:DUF1365 family protein n=1 Tax=Streptomyces avicenniae TaxID=500153 RepID=UPI0030B7FF86
MPALYESLVTHVRTAPLRHRLRHRTYLWLVDPDRPPRLLSLIHISEPTRPRLIS